MECVGTSLSYNAVDQKVADIMAAPCGLHPKGVPYVVTHTWLAQAALHAGERNVETHGDPALQSSPLNRMGSASFHFTKKNRDHI